MWQTTRFHDPNLPNIPNSPNCSNSPNHPNSPNCPKSNELGNTCKHIYLASHFGINRGYILKILHLFLLVLCYLKNVELKIYKYPIKQK